MFKFFTVGKVEVKNDKMAKLKREWQKSGASRTMSFKEWYSKKVDKLVDSWMTAA